MIQQKIKKVERLTKLVKWQNQSRHQVISHRKLEDVYKSRILKSKKVSLYALWILPKI
jgi:hypothetical protein